VSVLQLAQHLRLSKVGTVSVDGTKLQANASKHAAVSYARAAEMIAQLERFRGMEATRAPRLHQISGLLPPYRLRNPSQGLRGRDALLLVGHS